MAVTTSSAARAGGTALGFRRVESVRFVLTDTGTVAEVTGVGHRLPRTVRVPVHTAQRLVEGGVPCRIEDRRTLALA